VTGVEIPLLLIDGIRRFFSGMVGTGAEISGGITAGGSVWCFSVTVTLSNLPAHFLRTNVTALIISGVNSMSTRKFESPASEKALRNVSVLMPEIPAKSLILTVIFD
jgi:hypothetical protein